MTEDALVYRTFLLHDPHPVGGLSILRTNRVEVPIECRYPRSVWDGLLGSWIGYSCMQVGHLFCKEKCLAAMVTLCCVNG